MFIFGTLLIYLISTLFVFLVLHIWKYRRFYYLGYRIPGPSIWTNIQYVSSFLGPLDRTTRNLMTYYHTETQKEENAKYPCMKIWYGPKLLVALLHPDLIKKTYQTHLRKDTSVYRSITPFLWGHAIIAENQIPKWKSHRKIISGASLNFTSLKSFVDIFFEESLILGTKLGALAKTGQPFEPIHMMTLASFNMIVRTMCGLDMKIQQNHHKEYPFTDAAESAFRNVGYRFFKPWLMLDYIFNLLGHQKKQIEGSKLSRAFVEKIIETMKANIIKEYASRSTKLNTVTEELDEIKPMQNFVEVIIRDQLNPNIPKESVMSHDDLVSELIFMLAAGFDTTKTANTIILLVMALHQDIQKNVYEEIQTVLGSDPDVAPTYNQLQELQVLNRVIKETLRLFPTAPLIGRELDHDIEVDDFTIPKGASLWLIILGVHRDPRFWPNPNQFDPDRFLPSEIAKRNPNAHIPFSTGPRNCVGNKYAMIQLKTVISTILRRYRVLPGDKCKSLEDIRYEFGMTMVLLPGCDIRLEPRSQ